jgi:hypothetical protein
MKKTMVEVVEDGKSVNFADGVEAKAKLEELKKRFPNAEFIIRPYDQKRYQLWTEKGVFFGGI